MMIRIIIIIIQWRRKVPKCVCVCGGGGGGGAHRHDVIYVPSVKNQYKLRNVLDEIGLLINFH